MVESVGRFARTATPVTEAEFGWRQRLYRFAAAMPLLAVVAGVLWQQTWFRIFEADVAQQWVGLVLHGTISRFENVLMFPWPNGPMVGLRISAGCTVALLLAPLVLIGALLVAFTRFDLTRVLAGILVGTAALLAVNQIRIAVIAYFIQSWGMPGFELGHKLVGTLIGLAGFAVSAVLMIKFAAPARRASLRRARRRVSHTHVGVDADE